MNSIINVDSRISMHKCFIVYIVNNANVSFISTNSELNFMIDRNDWPLQDCCKKRMIYMYASCDWHRRNMYVCYLYLDMDLYCRVPCLLAIPSTDDGRHDKIEYVFYTLPHTKHCILNDHARSTSLTNARVLWNLKKIVILILFQNISIFSVDL